MIHIILRYCKHRLVIFLYFLLFCLLLFPFFLSSILPFFRPAHFFLARFSSKSIEEQMLSRKPRSQDAAPTKKAPIHRPSKQEEGRRREREVGREGESHRRFYFLLGRLEGCQVSGSCRIAAAFAACISALVAIVTSAATPQPSKGPSATRRSHINLQRQKAML